MAIDPFKELDNWKQSLLRLSENKFLDIAKMYCGTIKTPYNKEKLLTDIISFLYKQENRETILKILSQNDILLLNAIHFLPNPTTENLIAFFDKDFSVLYLHDYISNLEERQIIYKNLQENTRRELLEINPLFLESLVPYLQLSTLIPNSQCTIKESFSSRQKISPSLLTSWYSFVCQNPDLCRADGTFKKKILDNIETVFFGIDKNFLLHLNIALTNLGLFFHDGTSLLANEKKWNSFYTLSNEIQNYYICVASFRRFQRDLLIKYTRLASHIVEHLPSDGLEKNIVHRLIFMLKNPKKEIPSKKTGFFAKILQNVQNPEAEEFSEEALLERMVFFGVLETSIFEGKTIYFPAKKNQTHYIENAPFISINAGFSVTFLAEPPLEKALKLVTCMNLERFDTVCRFEITRQSCMRSFDKGENAEKILSLLEKASGTNLSQNLVFSLKEWYATYSSASLYHGYILQVSEEKIVHIENNPILSQHIKKTIAPGIYLFDFQNREDIMTAIEKSSLDFIGNPKSYHSEPDIIPFVEVKAATGLTLNYEKSPKIEETQWLQHAKLMKEELQKLNLPIEQKEGLQERIDRKLILTPTQLVGETVRIERMEASGIDFLGKVKVIEQAIIASNMVEVTSATNSYVGRPVKIEKKDGDAILSLTQDDGKVLRLLIGQARNVKRFRQPLF